MIIRTLAASALASTLIFSANLALAADQIKDQTKTQDQTQDQIFGSQLMTEQERLEHRNKMRSFKNRDGTRGISTGTSQINASTRQGKRRNTSGATHEAWWHASRWWHG